MNRIDLNILEKKVACLFFENKKKTYNIKQIKFFLNVKIDSIYIKDLLRNLFLKNASISLSMINTVLTKIWFF